MSRVIAIIHSDRGCQYASDVFINVAKKHGFVQSMSRKGNCWDNAVAESFFRTYKIEMAYHCTFRDKEDVFRKSLWCIESYYNRKRTHSAVELLTLEEAKMLFYKKVA